MPSDAGSGPSASSSDPLLPPVFTRWSESRPDESDHAAGAGPSTDPSRTDDASAIDAPRTPDAAESVASDDGTTIGDASDGVPDDAFIFPDGAEFKSYRRGPREDPPMDHLAQRLEQLAHRLRLDGNAALTQTMQDGDRLDAALAGLISGYLAGLESQGS